MTSAGHGAQQDIDAAGEVFGVRLFRALGDCRLLILLDLGHRTGLFRAASIGPASSTSLSARTALNHRLVEEWAGAMVTAGVLTFDAGSSEYRLPPEHARYLLDGTGHLNVASFTPWLWTLAQRIPLLERSFRDGAGVSAAEYGPDLTRAQDALTTSKYDQILLTKVLPAVPGLSDRLAEGVTVIDVGCGNGHVLHLMAQAWPQSQFLGFDLDEAHLENARGEASRLGLANVDFRPCDAAQIPLSDRADLILAFEVIHDLADPPAALERIHRLLKPDGFFLMLDSGIPSRLADSLDNPSAFNTFATSVLVCLQVSLAQGGPGWGATWGVEQASEELKRAGFHVEGVTEVVPGQALYVGRTKL
jgi:ubiquinone/menaquinone biosynthesis C-methylase UbiE